MAAGPVNITILDGSGYPKAAKFWSSDGTTAGVLQPMNYAADGDLVSIGSTADAATTGTNGGGLIGMLRQLKNSLFAGTAIVSLNGQHTYANGNGDLIPIATNMGVLFSDDFGGSAIDATRWDVIDGGLPAVTSGVAFTALQGSPVPGFSQAAIGTGTSMLTTGSSAVSASSLSIGMGTTNGAEYWLLSRTQFAGSEDITFTFSKTQSIAGNSIFIGLVEVDPATGIPLLNPNLANDFTNRGGLELGISTTNTFAQIQAVADSSSSVAGPAASIFAPAAMTTSFIGTIQFRAKDLIASSQVVDSVTVGKVTTPLCVSTQVPNDSKAYKLLIRFKNPSVPTATTVAIGRVLVEDKNTFDVNIDSGSGDAVIGMGVPVNVVNTPVLGAGSTVSITTAANSGGGATLLGFKLSSAATTNATSVKGSVGRVMGGQLINTTATDKFVKIYSKATAPTVGTDTPVLTITIPGAAAGKVSSVNLFEVIGNIGQYCPLGIGLAITGAYADSDTTAVAAGDVLVQLLYI